MSFGISDMSLFRENSKYQKAPPDRMGMSRRISHMAISPYGSKRPFYLPVTSATKSRRSDVNPQILPITQILPSRNMKARETSFAFLAVLISDVRAALVAAQCGAFLARALSWAATRAARTSEIGTPPISGCACMQCFRGVCWSRGETLRQFFFARRGTWDSCPTITRLAKRSQAGTWLRKGIPDRRWRNLPRGGVAGVVDAVERSIVAHK